MKQKFMSAVKFLEEHSIYKTVEIHVQVKDDMPAGAIFHLEQAPGTAGAPNAFHDSNMVDGQNITKFSAEVFCSSLPEYCDYLRENVNGLIGITIARYNDLPLNKRLESAASTVVAACKPTSLEAL